MAEPEFTVYVPRKWVREAVEEGFHLIDFMADLPPVRRWISRHPTLSWAMCAYSLSGLAWHTHARLVHPEH